MHVGGFHVVPGRCRGLQGLAGASKGLQGPSGGFPGPRGASKTPKTQQKRVLNTLEVQLGRASRTQETGGENGRGQRSDLGFKVSVLRVDRRSEGLGI